MLRSASRQALDAVHAEEDAVYDAISADELHALAGNLYAVADLLAAQPRLRRTLGDPATDAERRARLIESLLGDKIDQKAMRIVTAAVRQRWSTPWDLADALEDAGDGALFAVAEKQGKLDQLEDELFRLERILDAEGDVAALLDEYTVEPARRNALLDRLVSGKVEPVTIELLHQAVASQRKRNIVLAVDNLLQKATARQHRSIARVTSAIPLSDEQQNRLAAALSTMYGRKINVYTALDPDIRGGLVIRVGDEVIDGSVATRFAAARAALAG